MAPAGDRATEGTHEPLIEDFPPARFQYEDEARNSRNVRSYINGPDSKMWHSGIFGCFSDIPTCLLTCVCPAVALGEVAEISSKGDTGCVASGAIYNTLLTFPLSYLPLRCWYSARFRKRLRDMYKLPAEPCGDFCLHCWCALCAHCQELRELTVRGWNPHISYQANLTIMEAVALHVPRNQEMQY